MRVLHLIAGDSDSPAVNFALESVASLARLGVEQAVALPPRSSHRELLEQAGIPLYSVRLPPLLAPLERRRLAGFAAEFRPDLLQAWTGRAARFLPAHIAPRLVWMGERHDRGCRRADYLVAVDEQLRHDLILRGAPPHRCFVIPAFAGSVARSLVRRSDLSLPQDSPLILLPNLPAKDSRGLEVLFAVLSALPAVHLAVLGEAAQRRTRGLRRRAAAYGLSDRLHLLPPAITPRQGLELADVCLLALEGEVVAPTILEAWAVRRPVVALRRPEVTALIQQARNGLLFEPGSPEDLMTKLRACLEEPAVVEHLLAGGEDSLRRLPERDVGLAGLLRLWHCIAERGGGSRQILVGAANVALMQNGLRRYLPAVGLGKDELPDLLAIQLALEGPLSDDDGTGALLWGIHKGYRRIVTRQGRDFLVEIPSSFDRMNMERAVPRDLLQERREQYRRFSELQRMAAPAFAEGPRKVA